MTPQFLGTPLLNRLTSSGMDFRAIIMQIASQRLILAVALALGTVYGLWQAFTAMPVYQSRALLQVESSAGSSVLGGAQGAFYPDFAEASTQIEIIGSRMVLEGAVRDLSLDIAVTPRYFPLLGQALAWRRFFGEPGEHSMVWPFNGYAWGGEQVVVTRLDAGGDWAGRGFGLCAEGHDTYRVLDDRNRLIGTGKVGRPQRWAAPRATLAIFVRELRARPETCFSVARLDTAKVAQGLGGGLRATERSRGTGIIDVSYDDTDARRSMQILNAIADSYLRQNVERKSAQAQKTLDFLDRQLPEIKQQVEAAESRFNDFRAHNNTVDITKEADIVLQQSLGTETTLAMLQQRRRELLTRFTPEHPSVQTLDAQIASVQAKMGSMQSQVDRLPKLQQELLRLTRDLKVGEELYTQLLNNAQQLRVVRAGTVGNVRIIDHALLPDGPYKPSRSKILLMDIVLALMLGSAVAYVRIMLNNGVREAQEIEQGLGLSVLAMLPESSEQERQNRRQDVTPEAPRLLTLADPGDLAIESLRGLRTSLQFAMIDAPNNILMVTGPSPNIGKSFVSLNLAALLGGATGQRVLLIDSDMRRGHLHESFGVGREGGLSEVISGAASLDSCIRRTAIEGFDYLTTGILPPNPSELLLHPRFAELLATVSARYDRVLIDSAPVLAVTDAAIIGRQVGAVLMIARFGQTPLPELDLAITRLKQAGVQVNGSIINRVSRSSRYSYGYKYQYAYQYRSHTKEQS